MDENSTELLARIEILESEVTELRYMIESVGVVFEIDPDAIPPEFFLDDDENYH